MNQKNVEKSLDMFVDDRFTDSEEIMHKEIRTAVNDHLKAKLGLEKDPLEIDTTED